MVEHALDEECARVLRIADPADRAEGFRFDGGWAAVSEDANSDPAVPDDGDRAAARPGESEVTLRVGQATETVVRTE